MKCQRCATELLDGSKFCNQCGIALPFACPSCGEANAPGSKFCSQCGAKLRWSHGSEPQSGRVSPTPPTSSAERRYLTVMFCDLVGSTALSASLDVEDLRDLIRSYQKRVGEVVSAYHG